MEIQHHIAVVKGQEITELPKDLYIPPEALQIFLETFEGPLDLLLYLIRRQNLDILDIPVANITKQYMQYVELMRELQFELAAEYLLMAAMLAEIKSRMLLPRPATLEENTEDPRAELVRRLQEYERYKKAAIAIDELPREGRDFFATIVQTPDLTFSRPLPILEMRELMLAFKDVMIRARLAAHHQVKREALSVRERMTTILEQLRGKEFIAFTCLFNVKEGRLGVVVTFLALLELLKQSLIEIVQPEMFSLIHVRAA